MMGQQEALDFLKKHRGKWKSTKEICFALKINNNSANNCLKRLLRSGDVEFMHGACSERGGQFMYLWRYKE